MGAANVAGSAAAAFTPLSLTPALWIDPSDTTTMFQSNAGTTTVTDGSVCGYAGDKSGAASNLTSAADDTTRPTWNNNAGLPYLNGDGVNDTLRRTAALGLYANGAHSIFFAVRANPAASAALFAEGGSVTDASVSILANAATPSTGRYLQRNDAAALPVDATLAASYFPNTDNVIGLTDSGTSVTGYINGVAQTPTAATRSGVYTLDRTSLFALVRSTTGNFFAGRVYGVVAVKRVLTAGEIASLTTYLGAKAGLVL